MLAFLRSVVRLIVGLRIGGSGACSDSKVKPKLTSWYCDNIEEAKERESEKHEQLQAREASTISGTMTRVTDFGNASY